MFGKDFFEQMNQKISETLANSPAKDFEKNMKAMMVATFNKMDLVTREEFDIQQNVLLKTREQLALLETRIAKLEKQKKDSKPTKEKVQAALLDQKDDQAEKA